MVSKTSTGKEGSPASGEAIAAPCTPGTGLPSADKYRPAIAPQVCGKAACARVNSLRMQKFTSGRVPSSNEEGCLRPTGAGGVVLTSFLFSSDVIRTTPSVLRTATPPRSRRGHACPQHFVIWTQTRIQADALPREEHGCN